MSLTVSYLAHLAVQHPGGAMNTELFGCLRCDLVLREGREEYGCRWGEPHFPIADAISARLALLASGKRLQDE